MAERSVIVTGDVVGVASEQPYTHYCFGGEVEADNSIHLQPYGSILLVGFHPPPPTVGNSYDFDFSDVVLGSREDLHKPGTRLTYVQPSVAKTLKEKPNEVPYYLTGRLPVGPQPAKLAESPDAGAL